jgi:COMPASS component SWD1
MNLQLLDPFGNDFPEAIEECIEDGCATTCCFNRRGTLLAVGCHDGRVVIWDFDTRSSARVMLGHIHPVTSVSWARNGKKLLSSSTDWTIIVWDVMTATIDTTIKFESAVLSAEMHPRDNTLCLACPLYSVPHLVNLATGTRTPLPQVSQADLQKDQKESSGKSSKYETNMVSTFTRKGEKIFTGDSKGIITIIDSKTLQIEKHFKVGGGGAIKAIEFSRQGKYFLVNSTDRIIRLFDVESLAPIREFQDIVNKMQWKKCCFSVNGEYIIGGSAQKSSHNIYIWNSHGHLVKCLEGPKEGIMDLEWHPLRPIIASCSTRGTVYIWNTTYTENWSAFAPDFQELEENEEYIEREDEFDFVEDSEKDKRNKDPEDEMVDIISIEKIAYFSSDEEDDLFYLPTVPDPDPR